MNEGVCTIFALRQRHMRILLLNGPNLDLLGTREPHIYGSRSFEDYLLELRTAYPQVTFTYQQSNVEGEFVDLLRRSKAEQDAVIVNPVSTTRTSRSNARSS